MDADRFRALCLALPDVSEGAHHGHPDFRVGGRIFATLGPDGTWGMVRLSPADQATLVREQPAVFAPASGAWGRSGATIAQLAVLPVAAARAALQLAWNQAAGGVAGKGQGTKKTANKTTKSPKAKAKAVSRKADR